MGVIFSMGHTDISYVPGYLQCVSIHAFNHLTAVGCHGGGKMAE